MEYSKNEAAIVEEAAARALDGQVRELDELQLAMVGGGSGDVGWL